MVGDSGQEIMGTRIMKGTISAVSEFRTWNRAGLSEGMMRPEEKHFWLTWEDIAILAVYIILASSCGTVA